jgi:hypothetical protein
MFGGSRPPATYSSYNDFIRTTVAEPLHSLPSWIPDFRKFTERRKRFCRRATLGKRRCESGTTSTVTDDRKEDATTGSGARHAEGILATRLTAHASNPIPRNRGYFNKAQECR